MIHQHVDISHPIHAIFTDGGVYGPNPSKVGGTYSFVYVGRGQIDNPEFEWELHSGIGIIKPSDIGMDTVESNIAETIGILMALEGTPKGWKGTLYCDNLNSIRRAREPKRIKAIVPQWVRTRLRAAVECREAWFALVGGHPTAKDLERGHREDGKMVSKWNVRCDQLCGQAKTYLTRPMP